MQNWRSQLIVALCGAALIIGCGSRSNPVDDPPIADPPIHDEYPSYLGLEVREDPLPQGPARVSGSLTLKAPVLAVAGEPIAESLAQDYGTLVFPCSFGLFQPPSTFYDRALFPNEVVYSLAEPMAGNWGIDFDFRDLPQVNYELRLFSASYPDWGLRDYREYYASEPFELTAQNNEITGWQNEVVLGGGVGEGVIHGKFFVSGNEPSETQVSLYRYAEANTTDNGWRGRTLWNIDLTQSAYGRIFYEVRGLPTGKQYVSPPSKRGIRLDGQPIWENHGVWPDITAENPVVEVDISSEYWASTPPGSSAEELVHYGYIVVDVVVYGETLDAAAFVDNDLVVAAHRVQGIERKKHQAFAHLKPDKFEQGLFDVQGNGQNQLVGQHCLVPLSRLELGEYEITIVKLGNTNADEHQVIARLIDPVELVLPPRIPHNPDRPEYTYQPYPSAKAQITLDLGLLQ